jgi:uncharacterized protein (TIGR02145 family)
MNRVKSFLVAAGILLAMVFAFSCSSGDDESGGGDSSSSDGNSSSSKGNSSSSSGGGDKGNDMANYKTVKIGEQTWMAENLNYAVSGSFCGGINNTLKEENTSFCDRYGRLYDWETANMVCPSGWHLPSNSDWDILMDYVQTDNGETYTPGRTASIAGKYLKAASGWNEGKNGEDKYGFTALPGGNIQDGSFYDAGNSGSWWSSSEYNDYGNGVFYCSMHYEGIMLLYGRDNVYRGSTSKNRYLFSVRCVKD